MNKLIYPIGLLICFGSSLILAQSAHIWSSKTKPMDILEMEPPIAESDYTLAVMNNSVIFEVLENDRIDGELQAFDLVTIPTKGNVKINEDRSLTYVPEEDICDEVDVFSYYIANPQGSDTVEVVVEIICEELSIINGFSPDGDGVFDTFTIIGAERFPDNQLFIFDESGVQVYAEEGYNNSWDGSVEGEPAEEEKMYYYVFSDGLGNMFSGYVQITQTD